jgi:hypothetical protein
MTERRGTAREWRLYAVAIVASVYVLAWSRITPKPSGEPLRAVTSPTTVWLDELRPAGRPVLTPPPGWRVVERSEVIAPIPRRVPSSQPPRIRTRSS